MSLIPRHIDPEPTEYRQSGQGWCDPLRRKVLRPAAVGHGRCGCCTALLYSRDRCHLPTYALRVRRGLLVAVVLVLGDLLVTSAGVRWCPPAWLAAHLRLYANSGLYRWRAICSGFRPLRGWRRCRVRFQSCEPAATAVQPGVATGSTAWPARAPAWFGAPCPTSGTPTPTGCRPADSSRYIRGNVCRQDQSVSSSADSAASMRRRATSS
jgi:hypothetical protein